MRDEISEFIYAVCCNCNQEVFERIRINPSNFHISEIYRLFRLKMVMIQAVHH